MGGGARVPGPVGLHVDHDEKGEERQKTFQEDEVVLNVTWFLGFFIWRRMNKIRNLEFLRSQKKNIGR